MICQENKNDINNNYDCDENFACSATCRFSTLKRISSCLEDVVSH